jgi:hypothetical protein
MNRLSNLASALVLIAAFVPARAADAPADAQKVDFVKDVQPIFKTSCVKCHSLDPKKPKKKGAGEFRLDDKAAALKGGKYGADIVPGNSKDSRLFQLLSGPVTVTVDGEDKDVPPMPKAKKHEKFKPLPADQVEIVRRWIDQGADWADAK